MKTPTPMPLAKAAVLTVAAIKSATDDFDRGETSVFDALDAIVEVVEAYREAVLHERSRRRGRRHAA